MLQIFGDFIQPGNLNEEYMKIGFSPTSIPLQQRWRNNGLSADFLADYLTTFFPSDDGQAQDRQAEIKSAVSYIANELLENAMKFSYAPAQHAVSITMNLDQESVRIYTTNCIAPDSVKSFQRFVQELLAGDPQRRGRRRLRAGFLDDDQRLQRQARLAVHLNRREPRRRASDCHGPVECLSPIAYKRRSLQMA
jgi:hypothetical protein